MAEENKTPPSKISVLAAVVYVIIALFGDLLTLIPYLNIIFAFIFWLSISASLWFRGVKKVSANTVALVIELVPILSMLPGITAGVVVTIMMQWRSERKAKEKMKRDQLQKNKNTEI